MVIPQLYVVATPTTNQLLLLLASYRFVSLGTDVDVRYQLCVSGFSKLRLHLIRDCNLGMSLLDSSVGAFAITFLHGLFAVTSLLYW